MERDFTLSISRIFTSSAGLRLALFTLSALALTVVAAAQTDTAPYARKNSFGVLAAYSNDSSHILLGDAERRKLLNIGVSYSRRLLLTRFGTWAYDGELLPVTLESDPMGAFINQQTSPANNTFTGNLNYALETCAPSSQSYSYTYQGVTYAGTQTVFCKGRQWTMGEAMSPVGLQWNFLPTHKIQPLIEAHGGYMYSTHPIPIEEAGSFNFTFDLGAGVEYFQSHSRSIRLEYRYHHISNHDTALGNPGIDSGLFQVSYLFGR